VPVKGQPGYKAFKTKNESTGQSRRAETGVDYGSPEGGTKVKRERYADRQIKSIRDQEYKPFLGRPDKMHGASGRFKDYKPPTVNPNEVFSTSKDERTAKAQARHERKVAQKQERPKTTPNPLDRGNLT